MKVNESCENITSEKKQLMCKTIPCKNELWKSDVKRVNMNH